MKSLIQQTNRVIEYIGDFETDLLIKYLGRYRKFSKDKITHYLHDIYGVPEEKIRSQMLLLISKYAHPTDIYAEYYKEDNYIINDDKSRKFHNKVVRKKFIEFYHEHFNGICMISGEETYFPEVHHIVPLVYGGDNSLENLSHISGFAHDLLHENPREEDYRYCHIAFDHLMLSYRGYFHWFWMEVKDTYRNNQELGAKMMKDKIKNKLHDYYNEFFI